MFPDHILIQRNLLLISFSLSGIYKAGLRGWVGVQWPAASNGPIWKSFTIICTVSPAVIFFSIVYLCLLNVLAKLTKRPGIPDFYYCPPAALSASGGFYQSEDLLGTWK